MRKAKYFFLVFVICCSCNGKKDCSFKTERLAIDLKYIDFNLEIKMDTIYQYYSIDYYSYNEAYISFSDSPNPTFMNSKLGIFIQAPTTIGSLEQNNHTIDYNKNKLRNIGLLHQENNTSVAISEYYRPSINVHFSYGIKKNNLKSLEHECVPNIRIKNIVFDERYESWFDSDWFSVTGIDENTILE